MTAVRTPNDASTPDDAYVGLRAAHDAARAEAREAREGRDRRMRRSPLGAALIEAARNGWDVSHLGGDRWKLKKGQAVIFTSEVSERPAELARRVERSNTASAPAGWTPPS